MYIQSLRISNLRCFRQVELLFQCPGRTGGSASIPNMNLVLGDNGAGKTTILKAIALAALSPIIASSGFVPYRMVRRTPSETSAHAEVGADFVLHASACEACLFPLALFRMATAPTSDG